MQFTYAQTDTIDQKYYLLDEKLQLGDEFTYIVKYAFLNLGELRIKVYEKDTTDDKIIYKSVIHIDSYEGLPFVNLHQVYESWFDSSFQPIYFNALMFLEEDTSYTKYYFNKDNSIHILKGKLHLKKASLDTVVNLQGSYQDGLSILFYARFNTDKNKKLIVPCFINEDTSSTILTYYSANEQVSVDAINYDVDCFKIDGEMLFTGIFGLSGYFEGWFARDNYRVPISAELEVMIGHITIELMDWNRTNWQPPKFKEN